MKSQPLSKHSLSIHLFNNALSLRSVDTSSSWMFMRYRYGVLSWYTRALTGFPERERLRERERPKTEREMYIYIYKYIYIYI